MNHPNDVLEDIKKQLIAKKQNMLSKLASLKSQDPYENPDRLNDNAASDTDASEESSHERVEALEKELNMTIEEIDSVFVKIENGTYGKCQNCGKLIDSGRLNIKPTALFCVPCEKKMEK